MKDMVYRKTIPPLLYSTPYNGIYRTKETSLRSHWQISKAV